MSIGLQLWLAKRSKDRWIKMHARRDVQWRLRQQIRDSSKRGKGNRAWKRADTLDRSPGILVWPDYAL